ncbi:unnamed protein product [Diplocarpon coronariae]
MLGHMLSAAMLEWYIHHEPDTNSTQVREHPRRFTGHRNAWNAIAS